MSFVNKDTLVLFRNVKEDLLTSYSPSQILEKHGIYQRITIENVCCDHYIEMINNVDAYGNYVHSGGDTLRYEQGFSGRYQLCFASIAADRQFSLYGISLNQSFEDICRTFAIEPQDSVRVVVLISFEDVPYDSFSMDQAKEFTRKYASSRLLLELDSLKCVNYIQYQPYWDGVHLEGRPEEYYYLEYSQS